MIHRCSYCNYKSNHKWVVTRHMNNIHKAPTNTLLKPKVAYSSTEIPQHLTGYQNGSGVLRTIQQYDPRSNPQIQYNEVKHQGHGLQHLTGYQGLPLNGSGVLRTTQQYDPRAKPQIQNLSLIHI